nr:unnamed protein product [Callosobruchus analis]
MGESTIVNIYKRPGTAWPRNVLPQYQHPAIYSGDFNSHHTEWKYQHNDTNGERLYNWTTENNIQLIFDAKERGTFKSRVWNREYNPDLTFVTTSNSGQPIHAQRCILKDLPKSQHRPALTKLGIRIPIIRSFPRPRWNFAKANWPAFSRDLDKCFIWIPPTYKHYKRFVGAVISTAKEHIPRGFRKDYIPGWNNESETKYQEYLDSGDAEIGEDLLLTLDDARRQKWIQTTENVDFKH